MSLFKMDDYPIQFVASNHPLAILSGLGNQDQGPTHPLQHNGFKITSDSPPLTGKYAEELLLEILEFDVSNRDDQNSFKFKTCGRVRGSLRAH